MTINNNLNIVLAFKDNTYFNKIAKNIALMENVSILASSENTLNILLLCNNLLPDLLIFELSSETNDEDELKAISKIHSLHNGKISILATSSNKNADNRISTALEGGADMYMSNLDNPEILHSALQIISMDKISKLNRIDEAELSKIVSNLLFKLNLPAHYPGYHYFKSCIMNTILRQSKLPDSTSVLYSKVANEYNVSSKQVSRAIYKAVCHINNSNDKKYIIKSILNYDIAETNYELNAKELVALIADQLRIRYGIN